MIFFIIAISKERVKAETLNTRLKHQLADYKVPDVSIAITIHVASLVLLRKNAFVAIVESQ